MTLRCVEGRGQAERLKWSSSSNRKEGTRIKIQAEQRRPGFVA
jgi:hypothetical protein